MRRYFRQNLLLYLAVNNYFLFIQSFTELYVSRMEPSGKLNILSSRSFFSDPQDTSVVYTGAGEFEMKGDYLFIVKEDKDTPGHKRFFLAKTGERFVEAKFSTNLDPLDFHVSEVSHCKIDPVLRNCQYHCLYCRSAKTVRSSLLSITRVTSPICTLVTG